MRVSSLGFGIAYEQFSSVVAAVCYGRLHIVNRRPRGSVDWFFPEFFGEESLGVHGGHGPPYATVNTYNTST